MFTNVEFYEDDDYQQLSHTVACFMLGKSSNNVHGVSWSVLYPKPVKIFPSKFHGHCRISVCLQIYQ